MGHIAACTERVRDEERCCLYWIRFVRILDGRAKHGWGMLVLVG